MKLTINDYKSHNILNGLDLDTPIYKFFPLKYIPSLLQGKLYVGKVESWEDVYENFLFKQNFVLPNGTCVTAEELIKCNFGQSWTEADETDAMWRIYSDVLKCRKSGNPNGCLLLNDSIENSLANVSVRVKTTARKLFDIIYTNGQCMATYIGRVRYLKQAEINKWLKGLHLQPSNLQRYMAESLFIKRDAFEHEHEIRIIMSYGQEDARVDKSMIAFPINSDDFIEEILIDPRLIRTEFVDKVKKKLKKDGADETKIKVSNLYDFTPLPKPIVIG